MDDKIPDVQVISGTTSENFQLIGGIRTDKSEISIRLFRDNAWIVPNKYEFEIVNSGVKMGHVVTIYSDGSISFTIPYIPIAPVGTRFEITSILDH